MPRDTDLILGAAWSLGATALALTGPESAAPRVALALPLILFWPGYSLVAALFPQWEQLHASQRTAMSLGLSIAVVVLVGLGLNYSPWGVRRDPILASLDGVIVLGLATAALRRRLSTEPPPSRNCAPCSAASSPSLHSRAT